MSNFVKARALSVRGDKAFVDAINTIAGRRGKKTADFVKDLLVETLGDELTEAYSFFARDGRKIDHLVDKKQGADS